jgi:hypothetical protein
MNTERNIINKRLNNKKKELFIKRYENIYKPLEHNHFIYPDIM